MSISPFQDVDGNKKVNGRTGFIIEATLDFIMPLTITIANIGEHGSVGGINFLNLDFFLIPITLTGLYDKLSSARAE